MLRGAATALVLAAVVAVVGGDAVVAGAAVLSPAPVAAAVLLGLLWRALAAARWLLLARTLGAPLVWPRAFGEYLRSELLNQVLPGAVVGDVDRARRHGVDVGLLPAARAVALERAVGQAVLLVAVVVALTTRPELRQVGRGVDGRTTLVGCALLVVAGIAVVLLWQPWRGRVAPRTEWPAAASSGPGPGGAAGAADGEAGGAVDRPRPAHRPALLPALVAAVALSLGVLTCVVTLFVVAARATGPASSTADVVPAVLVVLVLAGIPLTVAGWGVREAGAALCFSAVGLQAGDGVAAAVGYGLLSLVSALPGLVPLLLPRRHRRPG